MASLVVIGFVLGLERCAGYHRIKSATLGGGHSFSPRLELARWRVSHHLATGSTTTRNKITPATPTTKLHIKTASDNLARSITGFFREPGASLVCAGLSLRLCGLGYG